MKHITLKELAEIMKYNSITSFHNSKTNKYLLINLVNIIEQKCEQEFNNKLNTIKSDIIEVFKK